jgi:hypothetical protein
MLQDKISQLPDAQTCYLKVKSAVNINCKNEPLLCLKLFTVKILSPYFLSHVIQVLDHLYCKNC